ncbi:MAG: hypothetical protein ACK559_12385, partial [bacterium]
LGSEVGFPAALPLALRCGQPGGQLGIALQALGLGDPLPFAGGGGLHPHRGLGGPEPVLRPGDGRPLLATGARGELGPGGPEASPRSERATTGLQGAALRFRRLLGRPAARCRAEPPAVVADVVPPGPATAPRHWCVPAVSGFPVVRRLACGGA